MAVRLLEVKKKPLIEWCQFGQCRSPIQAERPVQPVPVHRRAVPTRDCDGAPPAHMLWHSKNRTEDTSLRPDSLIRSGRVDEGRSSDGTERIARQRASHVSDSVPMHDDLVRRDQEKGLKETAPIQVGDSTVHGIRVSKVLDFEVVDETFNSDAHSPPCLRVFAVVDENGSVEPHPRIPQGIKCGEDTGEIVVMHDNATHIDELGRRCSHNDSIRARHSRPTG